MAPALPPPSTGRAPVADSSYSLGRRVVAECLGTALLITFGTGAVLTNTLSPGSLGLTGIALAWGFLVTAIIAMIGAISGSHINPAVTIALTAAGRFPPREAIPYVLAQCIGATAGSALVLSLLGSSASLGATIPTIPVLPALALEVLLSFALMATVVGATADDRWAGGGASVVIGLVVAVGVLFGGPFTGASMNPARSLGPAIVGGHWDVHWIYWAGPITGMLAAALGFRWLRSD